MAQASISPEASRPKRPLDPFEEHFARLARESREDMKRIGERIRNGDPDLFTRKRVRRRQTPGKLYSLFQCDRGHYSCIQCYKYHSNECRYCFTTEGSVVNWEEEKAQEYTNHFSCHKGHGQVIPKEDDFFCPDNSCQFCGPLDCVLDHITDAHSMAIQNFSYGEVIRIPLHLIGKYVVLRAEDGAVFVLWVHDTRHGKIPSVVCAEQPSFCRSRFTLELTYDLPPVVHSWI